MVRGRVGGDGAPFNLGEATVSRAAVRLSTGEVGFGYTLGRDGEKAQLIALCDALVQSGEFAARGRSRGGRAAACGDDRKAQAARPRRPRRRGSISTRWCGVRAEHDDGCRIARRICRQGVVGAIDLSLRDGCDGASRQRSAHRAAAGTPAAMMRGTAAIALTLFDHDTPIWLDGRMSATPDVAKWLKFHTSAPVDRGFVDRQFCADRRSRKPAGARSLRVRQQ